MTTQNKHTNGKGLKHTLDELPLFANLHAPPSLKVLRLPEVIVRVGLKRASIYQRIQTGIFPKPIPLGPRAVGWLEHEVEAWLVERVQLRKV